MLMWGERKSGARACRATTRNKIVYSWFIMTGKKFSVLQYKKQVKE